MATDINQLESGLSEVLRYAAGTDIGRRREENQDSFGIIDGKGYRYFVVADGMGGVKGGAIASKLAVKIVRDKLAEIVALSPQEITAAVDAANTAILERASSDQSLNGMGTTFVALGFVGNDLLVTNVGDSRAYRIRGDEVSQLTEDHTLVRELLRSGAISEEQAENHPVSHMLTRSLGPTASLEVDCFFCPEKPQLGDVYLLCSDGLYNLVKPEEMRAILSGSSLNDSVEQLIAVANERGGTDNITVIVITVGERELDRKVGATVERPDDADVAPTEAIRVTEISSPKAPEPTPTPEEPKAKAAVAPPSSPAAVPEPQSAAPEAPRLSTPRPPRLKTFFAGRSVIIVIALAIAFGGYLSGIYFPPTDFEETSPAPAVVNPDGQTAPKPEVQPAATRAPAPVSDTSVNLDHNSGYNDLPMGLNDDELRSISQRKARLREAAASLREKIAAFDQPGTAPSGQTLEVVNREQEALGAKVDDIRNQIEMATRKLTVWYGRRKRLEKNEPINMATEVAASSAQVKLQKEAFEQATYAYLKEAEILKYNPTDIEQRQKVSDLARTRQDRMRELSDAVRAAIDGEITESDRSIAQLTVERDNIQAKVESLKRDLEYVKVISSNDPALRAEKRAQLDRELSLVNAELETLEHTLPASKEIQ